MVDILDAGSNSNGSIRYFQAGADGSYLQQVDFPAVAANADAWASSDRFWILGRRLRPFRFVFQP